MSQSSKFDVVTNGKLLDGFEATAVTQSFAELFKISPEKAQKIVGSERVIKKNLTQKQAEAYRLRLGNIGLGVNITIVEPIKEIKEPFSLSLQPTEEELQKANEPSDEVTEQVICPSCNHQQAQSARCDSCGFQLIGIQTNSQESTTFSHQSQRDNDTQDSAVNGQDQQLPKHFSEGGSHGSDNLNVKIIIVAGIAALLGAFLWKGIALMLEMEFGIVAWIIGGAIGLSATLAGSKGHQAGLLCGAFALMAIIGGKYMVYDSLQDLFVEQLYNLDYFEDEDMQEMYEQEQLAAQAYSDDVYDDESLSTFLVQHQYADSLTAEEVTDEEIAVFKEYDEARLFYIMNEQPDFNTWRQHVLGTAANSVQDYSTWSLVFEDIGIVDILFLVLGIGSAYRLGSRQYQLSASN